MVDATAEHWEPEGARELRAAAWLTEGEAQEVDETVTLVVSSVRAGQISVHFANWLITQLAEEMAARRRERQGR